MNKVIAYGLSVQSEVPLFGVPVTTAGPQVFVRVETLEPIRGSSDVERRYEISMKEFRVFWPGVGTFAIRFGSEILIQPGPDVEEAVLQQYILGPAFAVLLHQRGFLVLHASAVAIGDVVVGFLGEKGWGKSTLAAALIARGHTLVADDILAVLPTAAGLPMVQPGPPYLKLWPESVAACFGDEATGLPRLHSKIDKRIRAADTRIPSKSVPLQRLYVLGKGNRVSSVRMPSSAALMALARHSYLAQHMASVNGVRENFNQCAQLARNMEICFLQRPSDLGALGETVSLVEAEAGLIENCASHEEDKCSLVAN